MKYLDPFEQHGLRPFVVPGYEPRAAEPVPDDVEEIRKELLQPGEPDCPACDLGGCMIKGIGANQ